MSNFVIEREQNLANVNPTPGAPDDITEDDLKTRDTGDSDRNTPDLQNKVNADMLAIGNAMERNPIAITRAIFFAVGSVRETFHEFASALNRNWHRFEQDNFSAANLDAPFSFGFKSTAVEEAYTRRYELHRRVLQARARGTRDAAVDLLQFLIDDVHGLGVAKGGFVTQFATGQLACIDTRNAQKYDVDRHELGLMSGRVNGARDYENLLNGVPETGPELWASWCRGVAEERPHAHKNGLTVSEIHRAFIVDGATHFTA